MSNIGINPALDPTAIRASFSSFQKGFVPADWVVSSGITILQNNVRLLQGGILQRSWRAPAACTMFGYNYSVNNVPSAGGVTLRIFKNGSAVSAADFNVISGGNAEGWFVGSPTISLAVNDLIDCRYSTDDLLVGVSSIWMAPILFFN